MFMSFAKKPEKASKRTIACVDSNSDEKSIRLLKHNQQVITEKIGIRIGETGYSIENLIGLIEGITKQVEAQMESIKSVVCEINTYSALAQEVYASTNESTQMANQTLNIAKNGNLAMENSRGAMQGIETSVEYIREVVNDLNSKTAHIDSFLKIIKDISSQTGLLSLNASIEAARAGDAGRGFAVVASEIKKLAQMSKESAEQISGIIAEINTGVENTVTALNQSTAKVKEGTEIARDTAEVFESIINAASTTMKVTDEISEAISHQTQSLQDIICTTDEMSRISENVLTIVEAALMSTQFTKASVATLMEVSGLLKQISGISAVSEVNTSDSAPEKTYELRTCISYAIRCYDPAMSYNTPNTRLLKNIHAGLLVHNNYSDVLPGLAKNWHMEEDGRIWVFNLRKGTKFHNGREITADDVKFSMERLLSPKLKSPNSWFLDMIEGARDYMDGKAAAVSGIMVFDRYKVVITLKMPFNGFLLNLTHCACSILDREDVEKGEFTGCGSYYIEYSDGNGCILKAFDDYFGGRAYIDRIHVVYNDDHYIENFIKQKYDFIIIQNRSNLSKLKDCGFMEAIKPQVVMNTEYAGFNLKSASIFAREIEVRRAMNYAVNKQRIMQDVFGDLAIESKGPFPPGVIESPNPPGFAYDPQKARDILKRAGITQIRDKLRMHYTGNPNNIYDKISENISEDLKAIGIDCELVKVKPDEAFTPEGIKKCDMYVYGWFADTGDPGNFIEPLFSIENYSNLTGYANPKVQELIHSAKKVINPYKRLEMYKKMQQIIIEDVPWLFLFHQCVAVAGRKALYGANVTPLGMLNYDNIMLQENP